MQMCFLLLLGVVIFSEEVLSLDHIRVKRYSRAKEAQPGRWPFQVLLKKGSEDWNICGGSLINKQWVLTAGHCVNHSTINNPMGIKIVLGTVERNDSHGIEVGIQEIHLNPNFETIAYSNDVALVKLNSPVEFNKNVEPACLNLSPVKVSGLKCIGTGWGRTNNYDPMPNHLKQLAMKEYDLEKCKEIHKEFHEEERVSNNHICMVTVVNTRAKYGSSYGAVCDGDSGGPLTCKIDGTWRQIGITWSNTDCEQNPSVFNLVDRYADWIVKTSGYKEPDECK